MKQVALVVVFILASLFCRSQIQLGMSKHVMLSPNDTISLGDTLHIKTYIKNKGAAPYSGVIHLTAARDTSNGVTCVSDSFPVVNLIPGDSVSSDVSFVPALGITAFKLDGNGNTIVVWPFTSAGGTKDSVRTTVYIKDATGIKEHHNTALNIYPNPAMHNITIETKQGYRYVTTAIYDIVGHKVKEMHFETQTDVSELTPGMYLMIVTDSDKKQYRNVFIKQ